MNILFEEKEKKFKTSFLKDLENNVKILKNLFEEVYIDGNGLAYSIESKLKNGRVFCNTTLNKLFDISEEDILKINLKSISDCLKAGKTKIIGYSIDESIILRTIEMDYEIAIFERDMKLNVDYLKDIIDNKCYSCDLNDILDKFDNKEFINIKRGKYDLLLTHKLFPAINKTTDFSFSAKENDNGTFYGIFTNKIEELNKKGEVTFKMDINYIYRFLDLN
jgi:hypothetical protein